MAQKIKEIHYTPDFKKAYRELPKHIQRQVDKKDALFRKDPFYAGLKTHKLKGALKGLWSFWVTRKHRVLFEFLNKDKVIFYDVGTHNIYK